MRMITAKVVVPSIGDPAVESLKPDRDTYESVYTSRFLMSEFYSYTWA